MKKYLIIILYFLPLLSFSQTFSGTTGLITDDNQPNEFTTVVSNLVAPALNDNLGLVTVCLDITHTYDSDLVVKLIAPDGTTIVLFSGIGGGDNNFTNTCFSQSTGTSISTGIAPFTGTFKPFESLSNMNNNQNGNGVWKLVIIDTLGQDIGILNSWSITFGSNAGVPPAIFSESNLPIVLIETNGQEIVDEPSIIADMKIISNGNGMTNHVEDVANNYNGKITIEYRGNFSQLLPQKPYKIETKDAMNVDLDVSLLGMPAEHEWVLIPNYNDKSLVRNALASKLFADMGHYASRNQFCEVVLNGNYQGIYLFMEKIKRDPNRVAIAKLQPNENTGLNLTGGYIIKSDYWDDTNSWILNYHPIDHPDFDVRLVQEYPKPSEISAEQTTYIHGFVNDLETALYSDTFANPTSGYAQYIDTNSFIDYFIVNELSRNVDGFNKSCYFSKDKDGLTSNAKLKAGPVWDFDFAWKNLWGCYLFENTDGSGWAHLINNCFTNNYSTGWYIRLLQDTNFQNQLRCRWNYLRTTILSNTYINAYLDQTALYLDQAQVRHYEKWPILGNPNSGGAEVEPIDPATYAGQIQKLKNWISVRAAWLDANMPGDATVCNLGIAAEPVENPMQLYPNPADTFLMVSLKATQDLKDLKIKIYSLEGRCIYENSLTANVTKVVLPAVGNGIYVCQLVTNTTTIATQKISINH